LIVYQVRKFIIIFIICVNNV